MNLPRRLSFVIFAAGCLAVAGLAQDALNPAMAGSPTGPGSASKSVATEAPVELPKMTVSSGRLADYPLIPQVDLKGGGLSPKEPPLDLYYPGRAYSDAVPKGYATVCIGLDEKGQVNDYLLVAYTEKYFGDALLRKAKNTWYSPLLYKGVAVPSRFNFGYEFRPQFTLAMSSFNAIEHRALEIRGGRPPFKYQPVTEEVLDDRLEYVRQAVPYFPDGYTPTGGKQDWVLVTFYVDEQGHVRVPHVSSASSPLLISNAIKAVRYWQFKPPTVKGKPALVYAAFAVSFTPAPN